MKIRIIVIILPVVLSSCAAGFHVPRSKMKNIDSNFESNVSNTTFKVKNPWVGLPFFRWYDDKGNPTLLQLFNLWGVNADSVNISFFDDQRKIRHTGSGQTKVNLFKGQFRKGYYQIFLSKKRFAIPPFIGIIYSSNDVYRLRIYELPDGDLLIDNKWDQSGNILFLGAGGGGRRQSFFKRIN